MNSSFLDTSIEYLKGVGPKRAKMLNEELGIYKFKDLLFHFPFRYVDKTRFYSINELNGDMSHVQLKGEITYVNESGSKYKRKLIAHLKDESGQLELVWFKGIKYIKPKLQVGKYYVVFGKPNWFQSRLNIIHPDFETIEEYKQSIQSALEPVYHSSEKANRAGLASKHLAKLMRKLLPQCRNRIIENLPLSIRDENALIDRDQALLSIHFPEDYNRLKEARHRLKFEELFLIQLDLLKLKQINLEKRKGFEFSSVGDYVNRFYKDVLPFEFTNAQKKVLKEIRKDLGSGKQMNRLLQGDVGSGKTIVALFSMLIALDNGYQACIMAPTEILAQQHFESIQELCSQLNITVRCLTGSSKASERKEIHEQLENGDLAIIVGTHALLEDKVKFHNLGIAIIDEQHRFGVAQRAKLWKKNSTPPHILIMTATPIPRTLAMTLYGDLDVSVIDELPPGRKEIKTVHWFENKRLRLFGFLEQEIKKGRQIYFVYPLIEESEKMDYANLEEGFQHIFHRFSPPEYKVSMVHGKMDAATKAFEMERFVKGETHIMVSTTVIEVGVNVPNASVMVIESAERFGLSQLHQLRGRVGRGAEQSYCILMTGNKLSSDGRTRMKTMISTNDGFQIAEVDLKLRGPGDLQGTQQSGTAINLKLTNLSTDGHLIQLARQAAQSLIQNDPNLDLPENQNLLTYVREQRRSKINWSRIA